MKKQRKTYINPYKYSTRIGDYDYFKEEDEKYINFLKNKVQNLKLINVGQMGYTYYFEVDDRTVLYKTQLSKGKYIIKFSSISISRYEIIKLKFLSDSDLIPKIYYISNEVIISKFIDGIDLAKYLKNSNHNFAFFKYIYNQIEDIINIYWENYFGHGDLQYKNIIITKNGKIIFIDPMPTESTKEEKTNIFRDKYYLEKIKKEMFK